MNIGGGVAAMARSIPTTDRAAITQRRTTEAVVVTAFLAALLVWLPLQTPLAVFAYQYLGFSAGAARGVLLLKDVVAAALLVYLAVRYVRAVRWRWLDYLAIGYTVILLVYAVVPLATGTGASLGATVASVRQFILPLELYALGRLAVLSGVNVRALLIAFLGISAAAALFTLITYFLLPIEFWASTLDLVTFIREVQGIPTAEDLVTTSLVGYYGLADPVARAVGPFTHPVGTGVYFVLPLLLSVAATFSAVTRRQTPQALAWTALALLFAGALIVPISRGSWIAAGIGLLVCAVWLRQIRIGLAALIATGIFLLVVPPFSYSIESALSLRDYSAIGHQEAVERGVETVVQNPFGLGAGHGDTGFNRAFGGDNRAPTADVGENMYLAILVTVGPLGFIAFVGWMLGLVVHLLRKPPAPTGHWAYVAGGSALAGLAVASLTSSPLMRFTTAASAWVIIGLLIAVSIAGETRADTRHAER